jgi:hypothetical protein
MDIKQKEVWVWGLFDSGKGQIKGSYEQGEEFLDHLSDHPFLKKDLASCTSLIEDSRIACLKTRRHGALHSIITSVGDLSSAHAQNTTTRYVTSLFRLTV